VALGGGVIGDIGAFCASLYMRGINLIQIPTTLLAQVDSSVGGKTGVNHPLGKNMIGTFYQPKLVWIDVNTLRSLPRREFLAGVAEVLKYGVILDREFFQFLSEAREKVLGLEPESLSRVVQRCCELKAQVVSEDEREAGLRAILNYGHTIGHAIETLTNYRGFLHGEAVAIGMAAEAKLSEALGYLVPDERAFIVETIRAYGLPTGTGLDLEPSAMVQAMRIDKKARKGALTFVLPEQVGRVRIERDVPVENVLDLLRLIKEGSYD
jgi:3-dehydroquinate synthase